MTSRTLRLFCIALLMTAGPALSAGQRRSVSSGPAPTDSQPVDVLGIGPMSGAAISGTVAAVQGTVITVNSGGAPAIRLDASAAKFQGGSRSGVTIADVVPGARITAFIGQASDPSPQNLPAQLIVVESSSDLAVSGRITSIDVAGAKLVILGITIHVDSNTSYSSAFSAFAPVRGLGDLATGDSVSVTARFAGPQIVASRLQVHSPAHGGSTIVVGTVKAISAAAWVVTGKDGKDTTIAIDAQTKIVGEPKVGDSVQVVGKLDSSNGVVAILIVPLHLPNPKPPSTGQHEVRGVVKSMAAAHWVLSPSASASHAADTTVNLTPATSVYPNPKVGDKVVAAGTYDAHRTFTATKITLDMK